MLTHSTACVNSDRGPPFGSTASTPWKALNLNGGRERVLAKRFPDRQPARSFPYRARIAGPGKLCCLFERQLHIQAVRRVFFVAEVRWHLHVPDFTEKPDLARLSFWLRRFSMKLSRQKGGLALGLASALAVA